jgi:glutaminyl-peptide cyclotransferase
LVLAGLLTWRGHEWLSPPQKNFNGQRAYQDVLTQMSFGPRTSGSAAHAQAVDWMRAELDQAGWESRVQSTQLNGKAIHNVIGLRTDQAPQIIIAAHYDSRLLADHDPDPAKQLQPVPGANDGASGVAVLLELARSLPKDTPPVWLVFFDAEDNGRIDDWDWIMGSRAFVRDLSAHPQAVVIVDMIGDADLNIYQEKNSDPELTREIWAQAASLGYSEAFIPKPKYSMEDDHTPFLQAGIPAVDLIDFDYPYWHTSQDTADKVSAESLQIVGDTLWHWVTQQNH